MIIIKIKNNIFKSLIIISLILILISLVSLLIIKTYSGWKENNVINRQKENKEKVIKTFKDNKYIFDNLVEYMYSREDAIQINFSNENIQIMVNGKEEKPDTEFYSLLNRLYSIMKCESVTLNKSSSGNKILKIYLEDEGVYSDSIFFCKDQFDGITDEQFSPGWYYKTFWYT